MKEQSRGRYEASFKWELPKNYAGTVITKEILLSMGYEEGNDFTYDEENDKYLFRTRRTKEAAVKKLNESGFEISGVDIALEKRGLSRNEKVKLEEGVDVESELEIDQCEIRELMKEQGLSVQKLSDKTRICYSNMSKIVNAKRDTSKEELLIIQRVLRGKL